MRPTAATRATCLRFRATQPVTFSSGRTCASINRRRASPRAPRSTTRRSGGVAPVARRWFLDYDSTCNATGPPAPARPSTQPRACSRARAPAPTATSSSSPSTPTAPRRSARSPSAAARAPVPWSSARSPNYTGIVVGNRRSRRARRETTAAPSPTVAAGPSRAARARRRKRAAEVASPISAAPARRPRSRPPALASAERSTGQLQRRAELRHHVLRDPAGELDVDVQRQQLRLRLRRRLPRLLGCVCLEHGHPATAAPPRASPARRIHTAPPPAMVPSCGITCAADFHLSIGCVITNTSVNSCGTTSCAACPTDPNGTATCNGTSCGITCTAGHHLCSGALCLEHEREQLRHRLDAPLAR